MHNPSGNVWRCGFGTLNFGGNNTTFRWFKTSFSLPVWDSVSWWILVPNIRMRIPMSSQVNWSIGRVHQFSKKKTQKILPPINRKKSHEQKRCRNVRVFRDRSLPTAPANLGAVVPSARIAGRDEDLLSVIDDLGTTRGPLEQQHGHGEDGGNHGGTKKNQQGYAMFMGLMINFIYHRIFL